MTSTRKQRWFLCLLFSAIWTLLVIQHSGRVGRLSEESTYDDAMYMYDGWWRLVAIDNNGVVDGIKTFIESVPHSPYLSLHALLSFVIFGVNDTAPYILSSLFILVYLCVVSRLPEGSTLWQSVTMLLLALSFQVSYVTVHEFRPDPFYGILVAAAVTTLLAPLRTRSAVVNQTTPFLLIGLSFYVKPTFFPNSALFLAVMVVYAIYAQVSAIRQSTKDIGSENSSESLKKTLLKTTLSSWKYLLVPFLLTLPLFILRFEYFFDYLLRNAYGSEENIWKIEGGALAAAKFFVSGYPSRDIMGTSLYVAFAITAATAIHSLFVKNYAALAKTGIMVGFSFLALLVVALGQLNTPFFGLSFYFLTVFTSLTSLAQTLSNRRFGRYVFLGIALCAFAFNWAGFRTTWHKRIPAGEVSITHKTQSIPQEIITALHSEMRHSSSPERRPLVFVTFVGDMNVATLRWLGAKQGIEADFVAFDRNESLEQYREKLNEVDFVLTAEDGAPQLSYYLPTVEHHATVHALLQSKVDFEQISAHTVVGAGGFYLFARKSNHTDLHFSGTE